jgi:hypothetical protein
MVLFWKCNKIDIYYSFDGRIAPVQGVTRSFAKINEVSKIVDGTLPRCSVEKDP